MHKNRYSYIQIGNTCGFYSIGCCLGDLQCIDNPFEFINDMVNECRLLNLTTVGEVFDIDLLFKIALKFSPQNVRISKYKVNTAKDILERLNNNTRIVFPINSNSVPHYIALLSYKGKTVTCCNGGFLKKYNYKKLFRLNKHVPNKYNWKKFKVYSQFTLNLNYIANGCSALEKQLINQDNHNNKIQLKSLRKKGMQDVSMKGYCLLFEKI